MKTIMQQVHGGISSALFLYIMHKITMSAIYLQTNWFYRGSCNWFSGGHSLSDWNHRILLLHPTTPLSGKRPSTAPAWNKCCRNGVDNWRFVIRFFYYNIYILFTNCMLFLLRKVCKIIIVQNLDFIMAIVAQVSDGVNEPLD